MMKINENEQNAWEVVQEMHDRNAHATEDTEESLELKNEQRDRGAKKFREEAANILAIKRYKIQDNEED